MLYLFKAARRPRYLKENLHLLAAERGSVVEVAYNLMWVAPELLEPGALTLGEKVCFVFTERPYERYVPVRQGELVATTADELMLRLRVLLHSWTGVEACAAAGFAARVKASEPRAPGPPGCKFLLRRQDDTPLVSYYDERENPGWERTVEQVLEMSFAGEDDPYRESVFFRPLGVRVGGELHQARRLPLASGDRAGIALRFYNPHLTDQDAYGKRLRLSAPAGSLHLLEEPRDFPLRGDLELPVEVVGGEPELTVQIGPAPARHTAVTLRLSTPAAADHAPLPPAPAPERAEEPPAAEALRRLADTVWRHGRFEPAAELDVLDAFETLLAAEPRLRERRGLVLAALGRGADALALLQSLERERLGDDARFLLFRLLLEHGRGGDPLQLLRGLELDAEARFARLLQAIEGLPAGLMEPLVADWILEVPQDLLAEVLARFAPHLAQPAALVTAAHNLYYAAEDARWAYRFLNERRLALRLADPAVVEMLLDLGESGGADDEAELAELARDRVGHLLEQGNFERARERLTRLQGRLPAAERDRLYHLAADRLVGKRRFGDAAGLLLELGWSLLHSGDLPRATEAAQRARLLAAEPDAGSYLDQAQTLTAALQAAWAELGELVRWRTDETARRRERLRERLLNRRILVAGGFRNPEWQRELEEMTGAQVEWAERYRDEGAPLESVAERIRQGRYALVIHYWQKSGHEVQYLLKPACRDAAVPWAMATSAGARGLVEAVWGAVGEG